MRVEQWDRAERIITWPTTKAGTPHCIPVVDEVAEIMDRRAGMGWRFMFPARRALGRPLPVVTTKNTLYRWAEAEGLEQFSPRDLRRTWKTLAGSAGISKADRDLLQNHSRGSDVSAKHYDRYEALPEKRAAVERWQAWLQQQVGAEPADGEADHVIDRQQ